MDGEVLEEGYCICMHCDQEFDTRLLAHRRGRVNECGTCATDIRKSIAVMRIDGKTDYSIEILANPTAAQVKQVAAAGKHGPGHCHSALGLNSNGSSTPKDKIDKVQESLGKESSTERKRDNYKR